MAYDKPNHTQIPNRFLDDDLPTITSLSELKVTLAILRNTIGYHRHKVEMDVPKLIAATGLSRQSVIEGIKLALQNDRIKRHSVGHSFAYEASLTVKKVDSSNDRNSQEFCKEVDSSVSSPNNVLKKETKKVSSYKPRTEAQSVTHVELMVFLTAQNGGTLPHRIKESRSLTWLIENHIKQDILDCFNYLKSQEWRETAVTWQTVEKEIGQHLQRRELPQNGTKVERQQSIRERLGITLRDASAAFPDPIIT